MDFTKQLFINYKNDFGKHHLTYMVGYEDYYATTEKLVAGSDRMELGGYPYLNNANHNYLIYKDSDDALVFPLGNASENAYRSFFGRITYDYDGRYLVQVNARYDQSSRFSKEHRGGFFPSVSAGWVVTEEPFMKRVKEGQYLNFLKIRASYGTLGNEDDRWIFTEDNPSREMSTAAQLAAASRVLREFNDTLSVHCLNISREIFATTGRGNDRILNQKIQAAVELYLTTGEDQYLNFLYDNQQTIVERIGSVAWFTARAEQKIAKLGDKRAKAFSKAFREALPKVESDLQVQVKETPYGVPYRPHIWGAGWDIQSFGYRHYFLASAYPEIFSKAPIFNALNFILGCHPGSNQASFASGVGAESATVGYGLNRADWSYIPGGVISGTALIRPDFPELLTFPFLWQQTEYVMGGGSSHYMFLVLAAQQFLKS